MAWNYEASDLFLAEGNPGRMKVAGRFMECGESVIQRANMEAFWQECRQDPAVLDRDVAYTGPNKSRWRVSLHHTFGRLAATLRQIKTSIPTFEALGLPEPILQDWMGRSSGLVLVTGPTGCGKSTTLASCLEYVNASRPGHVVTIEDPIEYQFVDRMSFFTQREVGLDTASFAQGLRAALRQAPNVIMVGEIRDADSAVVAVQAAETGHLVLGTLHAANAVDTLDRFTRLAPAPDRPGLNSQIAGQLIGILSQKLLKGIAKRSQVAVCEYMSVHGATREWIRDGEMAKVADHMRGGHATGCKTMLQALCDAYHAEKITYEDAMASAQNPAELDRLLRGIS